MKIRRGEGAALYNLQQRRILTYVAQWHRALDWAELAVTEVARPEVLRPANPRIQEVRARLVEDLRDEEEAYKKARPMFHLLDALRVLAPDSGPRGAGRRRVNIRATTWTIDDETGTADDPEKISIGQGLTVRAAVARAVKWVRAYERAEARGYASKPLAFTAVHISFWTSRAEAPRL